MFNLSILVIFKPKYSQPPVEEEAVLHNGTEEWAQESPVGGLTKVSPSQTHSGPGKILTDQEKQTDYFVNGASSGNDTLVIPSLTPKHSRYYLCIKVPPLKIFRIYNLLVCPKSEPFIEFFSEGGEVVTLMSRSMTG